VCFGPGLFKWLGQRRGCCGSARARFNGLFRNLRVGEGGALVAGGASGRDAAQRLLVERHGDTASRLLHLMHGLIYRQRRVLLVAFLVLFGLLVPPALAILSNRVGGELSIFGASVEMFAVDLIWENRTAVFSGVGGLAQLEARPLVPGWPSLYRRLARGSLSYRVPSLEFALWPSGTVLLSSVLFVDALLLLLSTGWPSALLRYLRRGIKGLRASSVSLEQQSPDGWAGVICACSRVQRSLFGLFSSGLLAGLGALGLVLQSNERWAILLLGCHYPVALNAVLAVLFLAHALFFAGLGSIFLTRYFDRVVSQRWLFGEADPDEANPEASRRRRRTRRGCVFLVLAALMITAMALVINYMEPENEGRPAISDGSDGSDAEGDGSDGGGGGGPPWKPHWEGICLATLCLFWSVVVMMAAAASVRNAPFGPFLPSCATSESRRTKMSFVMVCTFALVHAGGWTLLALSGYDLIWPRHAQLALGIGLLLSAALPAVYVCVLERKKPLCLLRPVPCSRAVALVTCVTLTLASSLAGVVLIASVADARALLFNKPELPATSSITGGRGTGRGENSTSPHAGSGIDVPAWSPPWQAIGVCGVLLLWATIPLLAGFVTLRGQRLGHLLPIEAKARLRVVPGPSLRPRAAEESNSVARKYGQLLVVLGTALLVLAFVLLVLSGFGAFLGSGEDLRNLLGACVLVTSLVPAMLACVVGYDTTACGGLVASTDFTRRNRWTMTFAYVDLMLLCQLVSVAVFRANAEFFAWWLGVIWIINAAVSFMAARVVSTRVPVGILRPLDPPQVACARNALPRARRLMPPHREPLPQRSPAGDSSKCRRYKRRYAPPSFPIPAPAPAASGLGAPLLWKGGRPRRLPGMPRLGRSDRAPPRSVRASAWAPMGVLQAARLARLISICGLRSRARQRGRCTRRYPRRVRCRRQETVVLPLGCAHAAAGGRGDDGGARRHARCDATPDRESMAEAPGRRHCRRRRAFHTRHLHARTFLFSPLRARLRVAARLPRNGRCAALAVA
jgi:hypothetical protein